MGRRKKRKNNDYLVLPDFKLNEKARRSLTIIILLTLGLVSLLGLFDLSGNFGEFLEKWLALIFGYGRWLVPGILLYWTYLLIRGEKNDLRFNNYLGLFLLFITYQTAFHFFYSDLKWLELAQTGQGGGYIGYYLSRGLFYIFGFWGGAWVLLAFLLVSLILTFNTSLSRLIGKESFLAKFIRPFGLFFRELFSSSDEEENENVSELVANAREDVIDSWQRKELDENLAEKEESDEIVPARVKANQKTVQEKLTWPKRSIKIDLPIELLNNKLSKAIGGDTELNGQKIKSTLNKFGIEIEMGETKVGPTVTQYTFRPAEGVKLSRITTLS
ncbi:MAG: DNA translocase FtsK 4TM domain-containing protein, partial [Patescibacteria group bacterium]|nr:DNA translocase FtsK 4TM domain-containing protein [Patescibacteria group bacterium]